MVRRRIGVIMGGSSSEREISLRSGQAVARALEATGDDIIPLEVRDESQLFQELKMARLDVAFIALHGRYGEDGCVQGMLEMLEIPYTGSNVLSSALSMDKLKAKELFRLHNVPTPPYYAMHESERESLALRHGSFGFPVVVKPRREGSSVGVSVARDMKQLERAVSVGFEHDECVLVERFIDAKEIAVGLLDGRVLGAIEIVHQAGFYDYDAKYESKQTEYFMPARLEETRYRGVLNLAERAAAALDCRSAVRVDLLVTEGQNEYVLEVNTSPGMTESSLLPKIAAAAGFDFQTLCGAILGTASLQRAPKREAEARAQALAVEPMRLAV